MSEYADDTIFGFSCRTCNGVIDGTSPGFTRDCQDCKKDNPVVRVEKPVLLTKVSGTIVCKYCGSTDMKYKWRKFGNGTLHVPATCKDCGKWQKWVSQTPEILAIVGPPPN